MSTLRKLSTISGTGLSSIDIPSGACIVETNQANQSTSEQTPSPLPYQLATVRYLKTEEPELWQWFSSTKTREGQAEAVRLDLLKSGYRIDRATRPQLYALADEVLGKYGLSVPVTFYQAQTGGGMNAALAYLPGEAHLVLTGPVLTVLSDAELQAVLGHELAHFLLYDGWDNEFLVAAELLRALAHDPAAGPPYLETARLFGLYTEVFADRGSYFITGDAAVTVSTLIKLETGLTEVSAESYVRQAEEIFNKSQVQAKEMTHPEPYIRVRALKLWTDQAEAAQAEIERMIEGPRALDRLDLLGQQNTAVTTRRLVACLLAPAWFQTEPVLAHARLFFDDFVLGASELDESTLTDEIQNGDSALRDYYCYVLLDFVAVDRELSETALAATLVLSKRLGLESRFTEIAAKELGLGKKQFNKIIREAEEIVAKANQATSPAS